MSTESSQGTSTSSCHEPAGMQNRWWCFLLAGVTLVVLGTVALSTAVFVFVTVALVALFGVLLLVAGVTEIITSFWAGRCKETSTGIAGMDDQLLATMTISPSKPRFFRYSQRMLMLAVRVSQELMSL